ncbi:hypothetical protein [Deinococcus peraridilitoris]|uniref:hypothetical protein n=1 Tax=Deinococcus peraridilitoris TaxID=432329 RepID=UPI000300D8C2|nr:hypothetical protein [Deinococcus peraridilitoris]
MALNRRAAARYGGVARPLSGIAREHLATQQLEVASPVLAHRLLSQAVREELNPAHPVATARSYGAAVRELLRVQADLATLTADQAAQVRRVARVTRQYRRLLRERGLVDGAEVLAVAAHTIAPLGRLTLLGYVRLTQDELQLLDALAGDCRRLQ